LLGNVRDVADSFSPTYNLTFNYDINYANSGAYNPNANVGLQVAIGGYEKDGTFYPFKSPNAFLSQHIILCSQ
jgi:hypothetical protein